MPWTATRYPGIEVNHRKGCSAYDGKRCRCTPSYRARAGRGKWSKVQPSLKAAQSWQHDARDRAATGGTGETFGQLWDRWLAGARSGQISTRGKDGAPYRPRTLDLYAADMDRHVLPDMRDRDAASLTVQDWQLHLDQLRRDRALARNTLEVIFNPVRAVYRWACAPSRRLLPANATAGLEMPAADEKARDRIVPKDEAPRFIAALTEPCDTVGFGLALYAGLRNMERAPLRWEKGDGAASWVDLAGGIIDVRVSKSKAGIRKLPIIGRLRPILLREWMRQGQPASGWVVPRYRGSSLDAQANRVRKAWVAAGLVPITPHEARHTFASYLIASHLNAKAVTVLMGHSSITVTFDRYGKLFPGAEDEAAGLLDAYLGVDEDEDSEEREENA